MMKREKSSAEHQFDIILFQQSLEVDTPSLFDCLNALASQIPLPATVFAHFLVNQLRRLGDRVFWCCLCVQSRAAS